MTILKTTTLFLLTACAEIVGCYLPYLWLKHGKSAWLLVPAAASLALFAWLLTLHPSGAAGRIYAAYGGVYVATALVWMWLVEKQSPDRWDLIGVAVTLTGMAIIAFAPRVVR
ncbi:YnfA family protein [bacterium]|nr:YnfA family protein [bacterium]